mmetsp:Transcript_7006/g.17126  ORF Transcript_7006/g.17126 Transcript_7006/m.17126 type:complete len:237 (+) Transcript_7006:543-1253(+)
MEGGESRGEEEERRRSARRRSRPELANDRRREPRVGDDHGDALAPILGEQAAPGAAQGREQTGRHRGRGVQRKQLRRRGQRRQGQRRRGGPRQDQGGLQVPASVHHRVRHGDPGRHDRVFGLRGRGRREQRPRRQRGRDETQLPGPLHRDDLRGASDRDRFVVLFGNRVLQAPRQEDPHVGFADGHRRLHSLHGFDLNADSNSTSSFGSVGVGFSFEGRPNSPKLTRFDYRVTRLN